jgi:hypothetical protein
MISLSVFLLMTVAVLTNDSDDPMNVAVLAFTQNSLGIVSVILLAIGIYLAIFSRPCPWCREKGPLSARNCPYCGYKFKAAVAQRGVRNRDPNGRDAHRN